MHPREIKALIHQDVHAMWSKCTGGFKLGPSKTKETPKNRGILGPNHMGGSDSHLCAVIGLVFLTTTTQLRVQVVVE